MEIKDLEKTGEKESFFIKYKIIEIVCFLVILSLAYKINNN